MALLSSDLVQGTIAILWADKRTSSTVITLIDNKENNKLENILTSAVLLNNLIVMK